MIKYQVITAIDEARARNYYQSYYVSDTDKGNIECEELPPYQDINKAQACYWDGSKWIYDSEKYDEIIAKIEAEKKAAQEEADRIALIPTNEELHAMILSAMASMNEITNFVDEIVSPLTQLASLLKGGDE